MDANRTLVAEIEDYCRRHGMAESTFGLRAVNDGKFTSRLRNGKRVTTATIEKARDFMASREARRGSIAAVAGAEPHHAPRAETPSPGNGASAPGRERSSGEEAFRFYDNRQKYLMFVHTCSEKWVVAERAGRELAHLRISPPALRVFDAGMGDGTVLTRTMRHMHHRYPTVPFYLVGKEISLEDVRLTLEKLPDRFLEHPATVVAITNLYYTEAPWLMPRSVTTAASLNWQEIALSGTTAHEFEQQISDLQPVLSDGWQVRASPRTGNPLYVRPSVLVLYREDHRLLLDQVIPKPGHVHRGYDLVMASQPYRARMPVEFKVDKVLAPLVRSLAPGGRMLTVHSYGNDAGMEIIDRVWPAENPFVHDRHVILQHMKSMLGRHARDLTFKAHADNRALLRYEMHTLPSEIGTNIGTSTLLAAWNAATYVAQIEDQRLEQVMGHQDYLDATRDVLRKHGGLWFLDESFVVARRHA